MGGGDVAGHPLEALEGGSSAALGKGAYGAEQFGGLGDHVVGRPGMDARHGQDRRV
jgi:hypothetical protein